MPMNCLDLWGVWPNLEAIRDKSQIDRWSRPNGITASLGC